MTVTATLKFDYTVEGCVNHARMLILFCAACIAAATFCSDLLALGSFQAVQDGFIQAVADTFSVRWVDITAVCLLHALTLEAGEYS